MEQELSRLRSHQETLTQQVWWLWTRVYIVVILSVTRWREHMHGVDVCYKATYGN